MDKIKSFGTIVQKIYNQNSKLFENILLPVVLILWCLIKVNQGVDVSDSTYSLGNYLFADRLSGVWVTSTYMSNLAGSLLVSLPFGNTLIGMNIYTGLVLAVIALICYFSLKKDFTAPVLFVGEFIAIAFCWIPTGILYNYLTYLLFTIGGLLIYKAVRTEQDYLYCIAGIALGLNVFVRIPNLAEAALILAVWWLAVIASKNKKNDRKAILDKIRKETLLCMAGYIVGAGIPILLILANFGTGGITDMVTGLFAMSAGDDTYTVGAMLLSIISAYMRSLKWIGIIAAVIFTGTILIGALKKNKALKMLGRILYLGVVALMLRLFWGIGMFTLKYYEDYTSMYEWGMIMLFLSWIAILVVLIKRDYNIITKAYAAICLIVVVITPLGSNNYTYQSLNNMFLIMPFTIFVIGGWLYRGTHRIRLEGIFYGCNFSWMSMVIVLFAVTFIQVSLFHINFVFRDGMDGTPRDTKLEKIDTLNGIYTNEKNAEALIDLYEYIIESKPESPEKNSQGIGKNNGNKELCQPLTSAIFWGDCPGLSYIFKIPPAISTTWPDLDTYPVDNFDKELIAVSTSDYAENVAIIWKKSDAASENNVLAKQELLQDYIVSRHLEVTFENSEYLVYR